VHGTTEPLPPASPEVQHVLAADPSVSAVVAAEAAERCALAELRAAFERLHDAALDDQRTVLRRLTDEPNFQRALLVANTSVAAAWMGSPGRRAKRRRHLETTVFHYLMRACGRATPNGAWAGVTPVMPRQVDADTRVLIATPVDARHDVTLNLRPFLTMLDALTRQPRYRWLRPLHLNPTLRTDGAAGWRYEREQAGIHRWVKLPFQ